MTQPYIDIDDECFDDDAYIVIDDHDAPDETPSPYFAMIERLAMELAR